MRRVLPMWACVLISVLGAVMICWPFSSFYWCLWDSAPASPESGGHPTYISGTGAELTNQFYEWIGIEEPAAYLDAQIGAILAIAIFAMIWRFFGARHSRETHCRQCRGILRGLRAPACPACGEPL